MRHTQTPPPPNRTENQFQSPSKTTPHVLPITRVLNLVTQHEEAYRQQELQMAELTRRLSQLEEKQSQGYEIIMSLKERNVFLELDRVRANLESLSDQLGLVAKSSQDAAQQHDSKALQLGLLATEIDKVKTELSDNTRIQKGVVEGLEALVARQMQRLQQSVAQSVEEQQKLHSASLEERLSELRAECNVASSSSESTGLQVNGLALKLRTQLQSAELAQQAAAEHLEDFKSRTEAVSGSLSALQHDNHKVKKYVVKLQKQIESLQTMGHVVMAADNTVRQIKQECDGTSSAMLAACKNSEAALSAVKSLRKRIHQNEEQQESMTTLRQEVTMLAESISSCLQQLCESSRRPAPPSYLQSLLGHAAAPAFTGLGSNGGQAYGVLSSGQPPQQAEAWDAARGEFDKFLHGHRMRSLNSASCGHQQQRRQEAGPRHQH